MNEVCEVKTWNEMVAHIRKYHVDSKFKGPIVIGRYLGPDPRIGWKETYMVMADGYPVGYLDCNGEDPK